MEHFLKKTKRLSETRNGKTVIAILAILVVSGGGYYYWTGTPQYALAQIKTAYETRNVDLAMKYIDFDAVFDDQWSNIEATMNAQQANSQNSWEALGTMIGQGLAENMKPTLKEKVLTTLKDSIRNASTTSGIAEIAQNYSLKSNGDTVTVSGLGSVVIELRKEGHHYWQVVAIKNIPDQSLPQEKGSFFISLKTTIMPHIGAATQDINSALASHQKYVNAEMAELNNLKAQLDGLPTGPYTSPDANDEKTALGKLSDARNEIDSAKGNLASIQPPPSNMARLNELFTETLDSLSKEADLYGQAFTSSDHNDGTAATTYAAAGKYADQVTSYMQQAAAEINN